VWRESEKGSAQRIGRQVNTKRKRICPRITQIDMNEKREMTKGNEGNEGWKNRFQSLFSSLPSVRDFCYRFALIRVIRGQTRFKGSTIWDFDPYRPAGVK
jgi:hypothetical protein